MSGHPFLKFQTPHGEVFTVMDSGDIQRACQCEPSGQWKFLGLRHVHRREFIPIGLLAARLPSLKLKYKNGHPQWTVRDWDHGSVREWGNTVHHGIDRIWLCADDEREAA